MTPGISTIANGISSTIIFGSMATNISIALAVVDLRQTAYSVIDYPLGSQALAFLACP